VGFAEYVQSTVIRNTLVYVLMLQQYTRAHRLIWAMILYENLSYQL